MTRSLKFAVFFIAYLQTLQVTWGQSLFATTDRGQTEFFSKAAGPAQDIHAIDKTGRVKLDLTSGEIEVIINMKNFSLPRPLMQKHYNERYMQTEKFPHASFRGTVNQWEIPEKDGVIQVTATGEFTVHGITKKRQLKGSVTKNGNNYLLKAEFETRLEDHNIEIPVLFFTRITEAVKVTVLYSLTVSDANDQR